jgi:hypothetical protein
MKRWTLSRLLPRRPFPWDDGSKPRCSGNQLPRKRSRPTRQQETSADLLPQTLSRKKKDKEIDAPSPSRVAVLDPAATAQSARQLFHPEPQTEAQLVSFFLNRANLDSNIRDEFVEF